MARELGIHRITLHRWESGAGSPSVVQRARYCDLLAALQRVVSEREPERGAAEPATATVEFGVRSTLGTVTVCQGEQHAHETEWYSERGAEVVHRTVLRTPWQRDCVPDEAAPAGDRSVSAGVAGGLVRLDAASVSLTPQGALALAAYLAALACELDPSLVADGPL